MSFKRISCNEIQQVLENKETLLIDIRDNNSYLAGHIDKAQHIDSIDISVLSSQEEKDFPIIICCYHGHSSLSAASFFCEKGFTNVYSLDGGYAAWALANPR
jgi:thiosulfate sulfurtransferase